MQDSETLQAALDFLHNKLPCGIELILRPLMLRGQLQAR